MSHSHPAGLLAAYNSLTDKHLAGYFNNTRIRRHLVRSGLITRSGRILSEKEYKLNIMRRDHQKYIRECLAQAIFHKVLDMERCHQLEIKKKLEAFARKERIQRFKGEPMRWSGENNMPVLSPHPPVGPKTNRGHSVLVDEGHSSPTTLTAPRPYTAPGNMQPPIRLQPLPSNPAVGTIPKITSGSRSKTSLLEKEAPFPIGGKKAAMKFRSSVDNSQGINRYQLLNIDCYMMPIPPPPPTHNGKSARERPETWRRRRRFRPTTAPNGLEPLFTRDSRRIHKTPLHSNAVITMIYLGKNLHLSYDHPDFRDEIKVYQQHCGGENLCVYKGRLLEKETFQFISKRHHGFPFSLTFFLNGIQVNRLSSCCEYKHRKSSRLGGKRGYFGFVCVERSSPCYKCIIAMGLDKKPTSPKSRKQRNIQKREELENGEGKLRKDRAYVIPRKNEMEGNKTSASVIFSAEEEKIGIEEVRTAIEEMQHRGKSGQAVWEDDHENLFKYEYEEDFEVDEEKQDEKTNEGQDDDQMNGMSKSPSDDEKDHLYLEKESETSSQKALDADDNAKDEGDGCSESELEEDKQDVNNASSSSSRSHPYSSCSEDESALEDRRAYVENSPNESARSSPSQELSENDEPEKSYLPIEDSLKIEVEDQTIIKADVETKLLPTEESLENVLEEEMEKGTQMIAEGLSVKSREHVFKEEKETYKSKLWEGSTANVKEAGPCRVEKGAVGQIIAEAVEPGRHSPYDTESGVSSAEEGKEHSRMPEMDPGAAPDRNLVAEEMETLNSIKESKPVTSETYTQEKEEAVERDEVPQHRDADTPEVKGDATLWGKAGVNEIPLGEWNPMAEQLELVDQFTEEREIPLGIASGDEAEAEGDTGLDEEGKEAVRASGGQKEDEVLEEQALMQAVLETEKAASEEEGGSVLAREAPAQNSQCVQEAAALREAVTPKGEAERGAAASEAGSEKPNAEDSAEEASTDLEDMGPEEESASLREDGSEEAILKGEEPADERKSVVGTETPLSSSASEKAEATQIGVSDNPEGVEKEQVTTEVESNKEDDWKEISSDEFHAARGRTKAERPKTPLGETESEREEVTRANALRDEDILEEGQKFKEGEGGTMKEERPEEETRGPQNEMQCDVENEAPMEASELIADTRLQEDSPREREVTVSETAPGFEKSLENIIALRNEGEGERLREAEDSELKSRAEPICGENDDVASPEQDEGPSPEGGGSVGASESNPAGKGQAAEVMTTAAGKAQECAAKDKDGLAGPERKDKEGSSQEQQEVGGMAMTQEDAPEGYSMMAEKLSGKVMNKDPEEEEVKRCTLGTGVMRNGDTKGNGNLQGGAVVAKEDVHQEGGAAEMAEEKRKVLADSETAEGKTEANTASNFSDVAEEIWHKADESLRKTAAAEKVVVEEIVLSGEEVPAVEEATVTGASGTGVRTPQEPPDLEEKAPQIGQDQKGREEPSDLEGKAPQLGQGQKVGEADTIQQAELVGEDAGVESCVGGQESGQPEEFRLGLSQDRESGPNRESPQDMETLPVKPDCTGTQEKQEHTAQIESESTDVSMSDVKG